MPENVNSAATFLLEKVNESIFSLWDFSTTAVGQYMPALSFVGSVPNYDDIKVIPATGVNSSWSLVNS